MNYANGKCFACGKSTQDAVEPNSKYCDYCMHYGSAHGQISIISDGTICGTIIKDKNGHMIDGITKAVITFDANKFTVEAVLTVTEFDFNSTEIYSIIKKESRLPVQ